MIEVKGQAVAVDGLNLADDAFAVGRQDFERITDGQRVDGLGRGLGQRGARQAHHQPGLTLAIGRAGGQVKDALVALMQTLQALFKGLGQLTDSQLQGRRFTVEGIDKVDFARQQGQAVVQRQKGFRPDGWPLGRGSVHWLLVGNGVGVSESRVQNRLQQAARVAPIVNGARPREKLARRGPASLSDAELIALVIRSGRPGVGAADLGQRLIDRHGSLAAVLASSVQSLATMPGLGPAKAGALVAAIELARRASLELIEGRTVLDRPQAVREFLALLLSGRDQEIFVVLFVDSQNRLIRHDEMFRGTLSQTAVYPRDIVKRALDLQAAALILAHNHPSGLASPSQADINLTQALKQALSGVGISVLDHVIVGGARSYSFAEHGRL